MAAFMMNGPMTEENLTSSANRKSGVHFSKCQIYLPTTKALIAGLRSECSFLEVPNAGKPAVGASRTVAADLPHVPAGMRFFSYEYQLMPHPTSPLLKSLST